MTGAPRAPVVGTLVVSGRCRVALPVEFRVGLALEFRVALAVEFRVALALGFGCVRFRCLHLRGSERAGQSAWGTSGRT